MSSNISLALWKLNLNTVEHKFHQYIQHKQSLLNSNHWTQAKQVKTYDIGNTASGLRQT
jgi:hypothetical protein